MELIRDPEWQLAFDFIQYTNRHVFLTGRAGTGKTTFLHNLRQKMPKRMVVVAPTGVAAINAGGVTIHSFFQLPFGPLVPDSGRKGGEAGGQGGGGAFVKMNKGKVDIIRSLDLLVIDEVSMVRADLLDAIDAALRKYRRSKQAFGGVQLLMIGDLQQLAPVIRPEEWELLRPYYDTGFFFGSRALQGTSYISIELLKVFRQTDEAFISLLNRVRDNQVDAELLRSLNSRYDPDFRPDDAKGYITLTTHNAQAKGLNDAKLGELRADPRVFHARIEGEFPEYSFPTEPDLVLKEGAQVMFVKNDPSPEKRFYNGRIGRITEIDGDTIFVHCEGDDEEIRVEALDWQNMKYTIDPESREIEEQQLGSFTQIPLRLAWAITIHKSQGLTFDKVIIDARSAFAHGQVYVALSRCRTLEGLVLSTPVTQQGIISDHSVRHYADQLRSSVPGRAELEEARRAYEASLLNELFDFRSLHAAIRRCERVSREHESVLTGKPVAFFTGMEQVMEEAVSKVAERFSLQLAAMLRSSLELEKDEVVQERIRAAAAYFTERCAAIMNELKMAETIESDNKTVQKAYGHELDSLREEGEEKLACLRSCLDGFMVKPYLRARALAALEPGAKRKSRKKEALPDDLEPDKKLVSALKRWRTSEAYGSGQPAYMVLSVKAIEGIAAHLPGDYRTLLKIKGIGKKKVEAYGRDILRIVYAYTGRDPGQLDDKELWKEEQKDGLDKAEAAAKPKKKSTKKKGGSEQETLLLFREGMKVTEIGKVRGLSESTIITHLERLIAAGELRSADVLGPEQSLELESWFRHHPGAGLKEAREALGPEVDYDILRLARAGVMG